jgi:hypothetical protein
MIYNFFRMWVLLTIGGLFIIVAGTYSLIEIIKTNGK